MKRLLTGLLVLFFVPLMASDTLTRAQVYNFSVGDTFDYKQYVNYWDHQYIDTTYINYSRKVITNIYYSLDSSTEFIERTTIYPLPLTKDTLTLAQVQECELCLDTSSYYKPDVLSFFPTSAYDRIVNIIVTYRGGPPYPYQRVFAQGLGEVMDVDNGSYLGGQVGQTDTFQLIYYAGGSSIWGSPYYTFPSGIGNVSNNETIVYPSPNHGNFKLVTALDVASEELWIYDMLGNVVCKKTITATSTPIDIQAFGSGVYVWKIVQQNKVAALGKIVVQ
jgi:hypothetical protein